MSLNSHSQNHHPIKVTNISIIFFPIAPRNNDKSCSRSLKTVSFLGLKMAQAMKCLAYKHDARYPPFVRHGDADL